MVGRVVKGDTKMGTRKYGTLSGVSGNGQVFFTPQGVQTSNNVMSAALALEAAVSTSLAAPVTGTSGAGSMDRNVKTALSASYSSITGTIL
jgi:hypothetical protein